MGAQGVVKVPRGGVKKASTTTVVNPGGSSFGLVSSPPRAQRVLPRAKTAGVPHRFSVDGDNMGVLVFIVLTVAMFGLLGLVQKLVERL